MGRMAQGIRNVKGDNVLVFIPRHEVPANKKVTYGNMICDFRPLKLEKSRVRLTVGGDRLDYLGNQSSPAASLLETKMLINSVISDVKNGARFMTMDLKDHFLQSQLSEPQYMRIHSKYFFEDIRKKYNIDNIIAKDDYVYCKIIKGMYGLKEAAMLARQKIIEILKPLGYSPDQHSPNIWNHNTRKTKFILCVDDFGIKYYSKEDAEHLKKALEQVYDVTTDYSGKNYCGLSLNWDYDAGHVDVAMPKFVEKALQKLQHIPPKKPQHQPHKHISPIFGQQQQFTTPPDETPYLTPKETRYIQSIVGSFLYYARAVDPTILPTINELGLSQAKPTENTRVKANQLLDYLYTHKFATLRYKASDMCLHVDSDAAYLVAPGAKSRIAGYYYLSSRYTPTDSTINPTPPLNAPVHVECKLLKHVVSSSAEAETGGIYANCQTSIPLRHMLEALDHPQLPTAIKTDNQTAGQFVNKTLKLKRSKSWDMRYFWLLDRVTQQQFYIYWDKGSNNHGDYFTKHWPANYHQEIRPRYILKGFHMNNSMSRDKVLATRVCSEPGYNPTDYLAKTESFMTHKPLDLNPNWEIISPSRYIFESNEI